jgi:hypothetical protein
VGRPSLGSLAGPWLPLQIMGKLVQPTVCDPFSIFFSSKVVNLKGIY